MKALPVPTARPTALAVVVVSLGCALGTEGTGALPTSASSAAAGTGGGLGPGGGSSSGGSSSTSSTGTTGGGGAGGAGTGGMAAGGAGGSPSSGGMGGVGPIACDGDGDIADPATGQCYHLFPSNALWAGTDQACSIWHVQGRFAAVSSQAELEFLEAEFSETDFWIGGEDIDGDGQWSWVKNEPWGDAGWGETAGMFPWKGGEPNNPVTERCLRMKNWLFESKNCTDGKPYLCERP